MVCGRRYHTADPDQLLPQDHQFQSSVRAALRFHQCRLPGPLADCPEGIPPHPAIEGIQFSQNPDRGNGQTCALCCQEVARPSRVGNGRLRFSVPNP